MGKQRRDDGKWYNDGKRTQALWANISFWAVHAARGSGNGSTEVDPLSVKLVIGIPTVTRLCEVRNAHRETWMKHTYVCHISQFHDSGCHIFPRFLFANIPLDLMETATDLITFANVTAADI